MNDNIVVLTGGVGGAKLVDGLYRILPTGSLTAIVNTGDDFRHFGLPISPDLDTLLYTLSGKANVAQGWGREGESWTFMDAARSLGAEDWFNLGDGDLALHILRRAAFENGDTLSVVTSRFAAQWGVSLPILPMSDDAVKTWVDSDEGPLSFQRYFVGRQCAPQVSAIRFRGAKQAKPAPGVVEAIEAASAIIIAPSNPWLSIDPILAIPQLREALTLRKVPLVAVSPLIEGKAVKGPTRKLMDELGIHPSNASIAEHYGDLLDGLLTHIGDDTPSYIYGAQTNTLMLTHEDRIRVARSSLELARKCKRG